MELIIVLAVLVALILMIRKVGVIEPNKNTSSNLQPLQNIPQSTSTPQSTPTTQNIPQNTPSQNNSSVFNDLTKVGLLGTAAGLGLMGAGMLLNRDNYYNYYNYYNPYTKPDTSLADHLHDLIWNDGCHKCDNDVIYNTFSSCDDTNFLNDSTCSWDHNCDNNSCWDFGYDNNNYNDDSYSWNSWDNGGDSF